MRLQHDALFDLAPLVLLGGVSHVLVFHPVEIQVDFEGERVVLVVEQAETVVLEQDLVVLLAVAAKDLLPTEVPVVGAQCEVGVFVT